VARSTLPPAVRRAGLAVGLFAVVGFVYHDSKVATSFDSLWSVHQALSLIHAGDLDLDEFRAVVPPDDYRVEEVRGHLRSIFPVGTVLLAAPLVAAGEATRWPASYERLQRAPPDWGALKLEKTVASVLVALAAALLFLVARRRGLTAGQGALAALAFAFATPAWSLASRGLWQHGPVMLLLALALWLFEVAEERRAAAALTALPLAFAFLVRPTAVVPLVLFGAAVAVRHRRWLVGWLLGAASVLVPFALWSTAVYGALVPPYYRAGRLGLHGELGQALAANLVSPARGLLVYAPLLLAALFGPFLAGGSGRRRRAVEAAAAGTVLLHWLAVSAYDHWWAGHGYGPRFMADLVPLLVYLALPVLPAVWPRPRVPAVPAGRAVGRRAAAAALLAAVAWGLFVHARGARSLDWMSWDETPVDVDDHPERVWDWSDPPFLRGLTAPGAEPGP
jgi:hypothetical protein